MQTGNPFLAALWLFIGICRYVVWPIVLVSLLGPVGLLIWLFVH